MTIHVRLVASTFISIFFITTSQRKETNNTGNYIACATLMVFSGISDVKVLFKVKFNWSYKRLDLLTAVS
jgi:hypothetical protein